MPKTIEIWQKLPASIRLLLKKLLEQVLTYVSKDGLRSLATADSQSQTPSKAGFVQIISRHLYAEQRKQYPALSASALKQVLAQDYSGQAVLHFRGPLQNGQYTVTTYVLAEQALAQLSSGLWLPETLLVAKAHPAVVVQLNDGARPLFCCEWQGQSYSALQSVVCQDANRFKMVQGLPSDLPVLALNSDEFQRSVLHGLAALPLAHLFAFWRSRQQGRVLNWPAVLLTVLVGWTSYLACVTGYLHWQDKKLQAQSAQMGPKVNELLDLQQQLDNLQALQTEVAANFQEAVYPQQMSVLLLSLISKQVVIERLQLKGGVAELTAQAPKAIEVLTALQKMPFIESANYSNATRRVGELEQFSVNITFKRGGAHD